MFWTYILDWASDTPSFNQTTKDLVILAMFGLLWNDKWSDQRRRWVAFDKA